MRDCLIGNTGLICYDEREDPKDFVLRFEESVNYYCTRPQDYFDLMEWVKRMMDDDKSVVE